MMCGCQNAASGRGDELLRSMLDECNTKNISLLKYLAEKQRFFQVLHLQKKSLQLQTTGFENESLILVSLHAMAKKKTEN